MCARIPDAGQSLYALDCFAVELISETIGTVALTVSIPVWRSILVNSCKSRRPYKARGVPESRLGQILMSMGAVSEDQITTAVAAQWSVPVLRPDPCHVPEATQLIPFALMERYKMLPVHFNKQQNRLHMAFAQAVDYSVLYSIEQMLGVKTEACMADESVLVNLIGLTSNQDRPAEYVLNNISARELVSMIAGYALRLRTERINASSCHGQIWVRATKKASVATHFMFNSLSQREAMPEASQY